MKLEVEVMSRETIKPSSPTPDHLRHYQLSFLDQIAPPVYLPLILFYPADTFSHNEKSGQLKRSLSKTLTRFYPLAGRVKDHLYVDCNDEGMPYVEARVNCQLWDVISDPVPEENQKLLPCKIDDVTEVAAVVQVNFFECGGLAIGMGISHEIGDGLSCFMFLNSWSAFARGRDGDIASPIFESATLFPPKDISGFNPGTRIVKENIVTKRFVFSARTIAALRDKYGQRIRPTRVEALSVFIWTRFMASTQAKEKAPEKLYTVLHAANLRTRIDPPLSEYHFGNISRLAIAVPNLQSEEECFGLVSLMRDAINNINSDYIKTHVKSEGHLELMKVVAQQMKKQERVSFSFTSLCRFPMYEADFGWGKPIWVGSASFPFSHLVTFMDTKSGDGIEAWINLNQEDMVKLETDKELLACISSPIMLEI